MARGFISTNEDLRTLAVIVGGIGLFHFVTGIARPAPQNFVVSIIEGLVAFTLAFLVVIRK